MQVEENFIGPGNVHRSDPPKYPLKDAGGPAISLHGETGSDSGCPEDISLYLVPSQFDLFMCPVDPACPIRHKGNVPVW